MICIGLAITKCDHNGRYRTVRKVDFSIRTATNDKPHQQQKTYSDKQRNKHCSLLTSCSQSCNGIGIGIRNYEMMFSNDANRVLPNFANSPDLVIFPVSPSHISPLLRRLYLLFQYLPVRRRCTRWWPIVLISFGDRFSLMRFPAKEVVCQNCTKIDEYMGG